MRVKGAPENEGVHADMAKKITVVDRAITIAGGSPAEFARRLSEVAGEEITRQRVHGWRVRGIFPRDVMQHVETLTKVPLSELVAARPRDPDAGNIVNRAIRLLGEDATPSRLAAELTAISGRRVTRQMVNGWQALEQFPVDMAPFVHLLTHIPIKDLVQGMGRRTSANRRRFAATPKPKPAGRRVAS